MPVAIPESYRRRSGVARLGKALAAGVLVVGSLAGVAGCQYATLNNYTPANGTQTQLNGVTLRDMKIVLTGEGEGLLSGSLTAYEPDELVGAQGTAQLTDGTDGAPLEITAPAEPIALSRTSPTQLLDAGLVVRSEDLRPGGLARIQFAFAQAGTVELLVTVLSSDRSEYTAIPTPTPSPSGSAESGASGTPGATPSATAGAPSATPSGPVVTGGPAPASPSATTS